MRRKLLLFAMTFLVIGALGGNLFAQISWTSKTDLLQNPSFESSTAASDLTTGTYADGQLDGWTVSGSWSNAQYGVANASTKIQGIGSSFNPSNGNNYFYTRNNWNANSTYQVTQTVDGSNGTLPAGFYKLSCQTATYSSTATLGTIELSLKEGDNEAITSGIVLNVWNEWGVVLHKNEPSSSLTITAKMVPGNAGGNQHYCMLLDDFKLEYISPADAQQASESNVIDFTTKLNNAGIYNATKTNMPRGWTAYKSSRGNGNFTEGTGDTQLEGWSGGNLDIDYYQAVSSLPKGVYSVTARVHSTNNVGEVYINDQATNTKKTSATIGANYADMTTESLKVTGGSITMGIQGTTNRGTWLTGDNFRLNYVTPVIEYSPKLPANGAMQAGIWYYVDINSATIGRMLNDEAVFTKDGDELITTTNATSFTEKEFEAGRYYVKSATDNVLDFSVQPMEGWEKLNALPADLNDYFYTFYNDLSGLKLNTGSNQGTEYKTLWYTEDLNPETDKDGLMTIVQNGEYQVVTCANYPNYMLQTEWNAGHFYRTHDNGGGDISWGNMTFQLSDGKWTIQNGKIPDAGFWGHWDETNEIAANRPTGDLYDIHAIKRGQYLQNVLTADFYNREDVSYVITNPEAERRSAVGWTLSEADAFTTQSNTSLGNKTNTYYFEKWQQSGNLGDRSMSQTLTEMKEGYYTLEVNTNTTATGAFLFVNGEQVDLSANEDGVASVKVFVEAGGTLEYGVKLEGYTSNWVAFDNFKLYYSSEDPVVEDGIYYLYNEADGFLARGADWGTRAVVDSYGIPVEIKNYGNNTVTLKFVDTSGYVFSNGTNFFTDRFSEAEAEKFTASTTSDETPAYTFTPQSASSDNLFERSWKLLTPAERNEIVNTYPSANAKSVTEAAEAGGKYHVLPQDEVVYTQFDYWLNAEYEPQDVTSKIGTPTFAGGELANWTYTGVRGDDPTFRSGVVELYEDVGTFSQTITGLDEGIYKLTVNAFERHSNSNNDIAFGNAYGNIGSAYMSANGEKVHIAAWHEAYSGTNDPNSMEQAAAKFEAGNYENEVFVYVGSDGQLTINVAMPGYMEMAEWFIMNNFTLTYYKPIEKTIATPEGKYYLRNKATGEYITFDGYWGTYYSMSDAGKELTLKTSEDGFTLMHTTYLSNSDDVTSSNETENYFYSYTNNPMHAFSNGNSHEGGEKWVFYKVGANSGIYHIMNYMTGNYLSGEQGYDSENRGWGGLLKETADNSDESVAWELVSFDELYAGLTADLAQYPQNATFLIGEPDMIAGFNNVYEEFYRWKVLGNDQYKYSSWNANDITTFQYDGQNGKSEGNSTFAYCAASDYPDILQTIENVPAGLYVVECQAVFRDGAGGAASDTPSSTTGSSSRKNADRLADKTYVNRAYLYANENMAAAPTDDAMAMRDRAWIYENAQMMPVNIADDNTFDNVGNTAIFDQFRDKKHTVQIPIYVTDRNGDGTGTLTIGVLQEIGINDNLLAFDRFRLTYYGENYGGEEVKNIMLDNLQRLNSDYQNYQQNTVIEKEYAKVGAAIQSLTGMSTSAYNSSSAAVEQYNQVTRDYGETSISWYIYNVLKDDYDRGAYTTASSQDRTDGLYPYVDEASKAAVVKYFGAGTNTYNNKNIYTDATYTEVTFPGKYEMGTQGTLEDLRAAISALRTYVAANAEARYIEDEKVIAGEIEDTEEARAESRMARMALLTGSPEAITTEDGKYPAYKINPVMFTNSGVNITAPELNKIVKNARCWAPRDAYGHRFYDYTNYYHYGAGNASNYEIKIDGLMTGKYLITISESHNNQLQHVTFNAYVGEGEDEKHVVTDQELFRSDESVWQIYTHSWQDVSVVAEISDKFEPVRLTFVGGGEGSLGGATMNVCNLRIYRLDDVEMLLLDENETILAKNGHRDQFGNYGDYSSVKVLLKREMQTNQWNTLTLPVNLTKEQVISGFGEGTIIGVMDGFASDYDGENPDNCIHFKTDDMSSLNDDDIAIEEGKVYLIKPTADAAVAKGETAKYKNPYEGQSAYIDVEGPIYYLDYVKYTLGDDGNGNKESNRDGNVVSHGTPAKGTPIEASGAQAGHLSLQMDGSYVKTVVPVGETDYVYAFQNQGGTVNVVQLDPSKSKTYEGFDGITGRQFKGFRGWITANYDGGEAASGEVKSAFIVLLDEGDGEATLIRGIDSKDGYSETKISKNGIYDLQGRAIDSDLFNSPACPKGVYIVNGKKVLVK